MTVEKFSVMDELPGLSFASQHASQVPPYTVHNTERLDGDQHDAAKELFQGDTICCNICEQQFKENTILHLHQQVCDGRVTSYVSQIVPGGPGENSSELKSIRNQSQHVWGHFNQFSGHHTRNRQRLLKVQNRIKHREKKRLLRLDKFRPVQVHIPSKCTYKVSPDVHPSESLSQEDFLKKFSLVSNRGTDCFKIKSENQDVDLDCQIVAVEGPVAGKPFHSPRTTRSLISQLSRESADTVKKRLSFCLISEDVSENDVFDSVAARRAAEGSLLAIDFSSPLGQRLKKHMKGDLSISPISDYEHFCSELMQEGVMAKLRYRAPDYPIMHRKRKGIVTGYWHTFKFNSAERREFMKTLQTGLNARSRRLLWLTKKCAVQLNRLRAEEIRLWTVRRRTIVNREIAIDDDISIVQVDVPEALFHAVQKMPVPSHHFRQSMVEANYTDFRHCVYTSTHQGVTDPAHQCPDYTRLASHTSYPFSSSHIYSSPQTPIPQFLVKKVNKNWTENGKESQKLVFVPLEETNPKTSKVNFSVRGISVPVGSVKPSSSSSNGIQKSLPKHLRPCPKSRRKQPVIDDDNSDKEIGVQSASSSDEKEFSRPSSGEQQRHLAEMTYPVTISSAVENCQVSSWIMTDQPVPELLHIAGSSVTTASSVPISSELVIPVQLRLSQNLQKNASGDPVHLHQSVASQQSMTVSSSVPDYDNPSELRKRHSMFNLTPSTASWILQSSSGVKEDRVRDVHSTKTNSSTFPQLSIDAVYSAADLSNKKLAASLGLECIETTVISKQVGALQQSDTFQPDHQRQLNGSLQQFQPQCYHTVQQSSKWQHPSHSELPPLDEALLNHQPSSNHILPVTSSSRNLQNMQTHNKIHSGHQPSILRGSTGMQNPSEVVQKVSAKPAESKPSSVQVCSSSDWMVVPATDDDVVEVICIDDDD